MDEHGFPMISGLVERLMSVDVTEIFSPLRVTAHAKRFGLSIGDACDMSIGWDFRFSTHRDAAYQHVRNENPLVVIGRRPCTAFSQLQTVNPDMPSKRNNLREGEEHMRFMMSIYQMQVEEGRIFLHEHPAQADSWMEKCMQQLLEQEGVSSVVMDQCQL